MNSSGLLNLTGNSTIDFTKEGSEHELGGEGLEMAKGSSMRIGRGKMKVPFPGNGIEFEFPMYGYNLL